MDAKQWTQADAQIPQVSKVLENVAAGIEKAAADFEQELKGVN
jgi:hypothetical protein